MSALLAVSTIVSGTITAFYLFDVGDVIALPAVAERLGTTTSPRFASKQPSPAYVQYRESPVVVDGARIGIDVAGEYAVRFKVFDYGVVSIALSRSTPADWDDLLAQGAGLYENADLLHEAERLCRSFLERIRSAVTRPRDALLTEDYFVFAVSRLEGDPDAATVLATHGGAIAQLLRGERERLSDQERTEVLRHSLSYLACDLVVPTWNGAFVYDSEAGVQGAMEILEFANSQLLQFRYYDALLDRELEGIYSQLQRPFWIQSGFGRRYTRAARYVHALFVDVNELTDRTENALKIAGDVYAARLLALASGRLGLDHWKATVEDKLETLDDIYRFAVEQTAMTRGELMELAVVLILVLELGLIIAGVLK
jgi:hypothetical protein